MSFGDEAPEPPALDDAAFQRFVAALRARLEQGAREYGDAGFQRPPAELLSELREEALDLAG